MTPSFDSFLQAGFECSSHRRRDGVRLDLIRATSHDKHIFEDYQVLAGLGFRTLRDGLRWHLVEKAPGLMIGLAGFRGWRQPSFLLGPQITNGIDPFG